MTKSECYSLGKITKTHGLQGEFIIWLDVDHPEFYEELESVFVEEKGELIPYFIEELQIRGKKSICKFEELDTIESIEYLINCDLYLPLNNLPELEGENFYYHEIVGFEVFDLNTSKVLGNVLTVFEGAGQDLLAVEIEGKEILIPIADEIIAKVDKTTKRIDLNVPLGLVELYLEEK